VVLPAVVEELLSEMAAAVQESARSTVPRSS
ncbi:ZSWIM7 isoform 1, partial [Pongo abelii]